MGSSSGNYLYDANGSLTSDPYKYMTLAYNVLNRLDSINFLATSGKKISYIYTADGVMIRKIANNGAGGVTTTDYIDGFVCVNSTLSYFAMPEGRIVNNGGNLVPEYVITDQQGNARITFNNTGTGNGAKVIQENSYYGFGMVMPGSAVTTTPVPPNNNLYNGGSELQNDFSDLPNLMQTFYRNYDAVLGRWTGVDPEAESKSSMTTYQYAGNNPIMINDPLGNKVNPNYVNNGGYDPNGVEGTLAEFDQNNPAAVCGVCIAFDLSGGGGGATNIYTANPNANVNGTNGVNYEINLDGSVTAMQNGSAADSYSQEVLTSQEFYSDGTTDYIEDHTVQQGLSDFQGQLALGMLNLDPNQGNVPIFGTTLTTEAGLPQGNYDTFLGRNLLSVKYTPYKGVVDNKVKGIFNFNTTILNGEKDHDVSIDIGKFSYSMGLTSRSVTIDDYTLNVGMSIVSGLTINGSHTDNDQIQGFQLQINPYKSIPAAATLLYTTAPYWVPWVVRLAPLGL